MQYIKISELLKRGAAALSSSGIEAASFEARELLKFVLGIEDTLSLYKMDSVDEIVLEKFDSLLGQRVKRYPLQYILGFWDFYGRKFSVKEGVLIPRPDTECLIEQALSVAKKINPLGDPLRILDLCSGSGVIAITLSLELPGSDVDALELSRQALDVLHENTRQLHASVNVYSADVKTFTPNKKYHLILSNPPYIPSDDWDSLQPEVKYEPEMALLASQNGLFFYQIIIERYAYALVPGGYFILEVGIGQAKEVANLAKQKGFIDIEVISDVSQIPRVVIAKKKIGSYGKSC